MEQRIKNSLLKIYAEPTVKPTLGAGSELMQIRRIYRSHHSYPGTSIPDLEARTFSFRSIVKIDGRWHLDTPYYCYSGPHRLRPLPRRLARKITITAILGNSARCAREILERAKALARKWSPCRAIKAYFQDRASRRAWKQFIG